MTPEPAPPAVNPVLARATDGRLGLRPLTRVEMAAFGLSAPLVLFFVVELATGDPQRWGVSRQALAHGRWETVFSHMVAHAGLVHLVMSLGAMTSMTAALLTRWGLGPVAMLRWLALFMIGGLAALAGFLLIHPDDGLPMLGASGAICALWGAVARMDLTTGARLPLISRSVLRHVRQFAISNAILFALLYVLTGGRGYLAWEAHLGGFVFGLLAGPWFEVRGEEIPAGRVG